MGVSTGESTAMAIKLMWLLGTVLATSPCPQVPALVGFWSVHILIEVMGMIPVCW